MFISSIWAYDSPYKSVKSFFDEIKLGILFLVVLLSIEFNHKLVKYILLAFMLSMLLGNIHFFSKAISNIEYVDISNFTIDRFYSQYFEVVYPFVLAFFLYTTNKYYKILTAFIVLSGIILILLTGARGSWLALFIETIIIMVLSWSAISKKLKLFVIISSAIFLTIFSIIYNNFNIVNNKTNQKFDTSGRDIIITDRLPIIIANNNLMAGMGYGTHQYLQFMNNNNAPKRVGRFNDNENVYFHDEPYLLSFFYHFGFIGIVLFIILITLFVKDLLYKIRQASTMHKFYLIAILSSFVGVFLIRGLFEDRHFVYFIILFTLFVIQEPVYENSIHLSRKTSSKKC
jgi:O-antigen ligase